MTDTSDAGSVEALRGKLCQETFSQETLSDKGFTSYINHVKIYFA